MFSILISNIRSIVFKIKYNPLWYENGKKSMMKVNAASGIVRYVPNQDERAECYVGGVEDREGNRWSCRKHRLYKSRYWQVVSITIAPATVLYENSNDLCTDIRFAFACISNVSYKKIVKVFDGPADCRDIEKKYRSIYFKAVALFQGKKFNL